MFFHVLKNELKYQFKNITFYIMAILLVAFCMTQMELPSKNETLLSKEELFGNIASSEEESFHRIKNSAMQSLSIVINSKEVGTYDFGFIRYYKFEDDQIKVLEEFKGQLEASTTIDEIEKIYGEIDEFIGKKTGIFSSEKIREARESALTDEEAEKKIAELKEKEKISGTYGRLYADYMGIAFAILPVFLSAFVIVRDKKSKMEEIIYSKRISSAAYIGGKYMAVVLSVFIVLMAITAYVTMIFYRNAVFNGYEFNIFGFFKYAITWLMPTVIFVTAFSLAFSIIFDSSLVPVIVQIIIWAGSIVTSPLLSEFRLYNLVIRFNVVGSYDYYMRNINNLIINRVFFTVLGLAFLALAIFAYNKVRGNMNGRRILLQFKNIRK